MSDGEFKKRLKSLGKWEDLSYEQTVVFMISFRDCALLVDEAKREFPIVIPKGGLKVGVGIEGKVPGEFFVTALSDWFLKWFGEASTLTEPSLKEVTQR